MGVRPELVSEGGIFVYGLRLDLDVNKCRFGSIRESERLFDVCRFESQHRPCRYQLQVLKLSSSSDSQIKPRGNVPGFFHLKRSNA